MPPLDEIQLHFRDAVIHGDVRLIAETLIGGQNPEKRLAIHQRNYQTSLVDALLMKFPATEWLIGTPLVTEAAKSFVRENPPGAPCIAEYGDTFPYFLGKYTAAYGLPYLQEFAQLEWYVGKAAIAVDQPPSKSGVHYLHASWPVDELLKLYLTDSAPDQFAITPVDVWIEVRGSRGEFELNRLDPAKMIEDKNDDDF
jgi:hypothetical protein